MKNMKQKILSLLTAGVMLASTATGFASNAAGENVVKFGTPEIDGVKDSLYNSSFTISLKDLHKMGMLKDMNSFQFMQNEFFDIYFDYFNMDLATGYIKIIDPNGAEIDHATFMEEYWGDYTELPAGTTFRWTDAGVESEFFTNATFSFAWDEKSLYVYVDVKDNNNLVYTDQMIQDNFTSPWGSYPWLIDCVTPSFTIEGLKFTSYKWDGNDVVVDEASSKADTSFSVTALSDAKIYYDPQSCAEQYYDTEALAPYIDPLTYINPYHINWWERGAYIDGEGPGRYYRELVCDGSDTTYNDNGVASTCADSHDVFVSRHVFTEERIAKRDEDRAANLKYLAGGLNDNGYTLEMAIPLVGDTWKAIRDNGYKLGFTSQVTDADASPFGNFSGGNASYWYFTETNSIDLTLDTPDCDGNHKYHDGYTTVEPTCTAGEATYVCALCDDSYTGEIAPVLDHTPVDAPATDATCTDPAYTAGTVCDRCGEYLSGHEAQGDPIGHTDEDKNLICDVCGESTHLPGDINGDGELNTKDLTRLMRSFSGENVELIQPDVNNDGAVNTKDLTRLMRYFAGESVELN